MLCGTKKGLTYSLDSIKDPIVTFRMVVLIVDVLRHRPQQVQLYLFGCRGESQTRVVVGEQRLVIFQG